jgi:hypothetical protein
MAPNEQKQYTPKRNRTQNKGPYTGRQVKGDSMRIAVIGAAISLTRLISDPNPAGLRRC